MFRFAFGIYATCLSSKALSLPLLSAELIREEGDIRQVIR
jgi:hypothetical protein